VRHHQGGDYNTLNRAVLFFSLCIMYKRERAVVAQGSGKERRSQRNNKGESNT
jgi:hypothetical protein